MHSYLAKCLLQKRIHIISQHMKVHKKVAGIQTVGAVPTSASFWPSGRYLSGMPDFIQNEQISDTLLLLLVLLSCIQGVIMFSMSWLTILTLSSLWLCAGLPCTIHKFVAAFCHYPNAEHEVPQRARKYLYARMQSLLLSQLQEVSMPQTFIKRSWQTNTHLNLQSRMEYQVSS